MANPATDRQRVTLVILAVSSVALSAMAYRVVNAATTAASRPVPASDVAGLTGFLGPLPDAPRLADVVGGTMVGEHDPFGSTVPAPNVLVPSAGTTASRPKSGAGPQWVVSSILFEESRRSAIVDNAWVGVGDLLRGGARVTAIERKHIIVTDVNGNRHRVPIRGGER
jgi:hypothetical protein